MQCNVLMDEIHNMYRKMYWSQILNIKTSWSVKWMAIKGLRAIRNIRKGASHVKNV